MKLLPENRDELDFLQATATKAVRAAQQELLAKYIGYVYQRDDGRIVRHQADGTEEIISSGCVFVHVVNGVDNTRP